MEASKREEVSRQAWAALKDRALEGDPEAIRLALKHGLIDRPADHDDDDDGPLMVRAC